MANRIKKKSAPNDSGKKEYARENRERAAHVRGILDADKRYSANTEGYETALTDLLVDIRHFCDSRSFDFGAVDRVAYGHYSAEVVQARTGVPQ